MKVFLVFILALFVAACSTCPKKQESAAAKSGAQKQVTKSRSEDLNSAIMVFTAAINDNPKNGSAYYNRAKAYYFKKDYEQSWKDIRKAKALGFAVDEQFLNKLRKASGKDK